MMDPFLRRVVQQRELEQEAAIIALPVEALVPQPCRVCGGEINMMEGVQLAVCSKCGGRRRQLLLELADQQQAANVRRRRALLSFAGIHVREHMADEEIRKCPTCGKKLRVDNQRGYCSKCLAGGGGEASADGSTPPLRRKPSADVMKRFRVVAEALGRDPQQMLNDFAEGWLESLAGKMKAMEPDKVEY